MSLPNRVDVICPETVDRNGGWGAAPLTQPGGSALGHTRQCALNFGGYQCDCPLVPVRFPATKETPWTAKTSGELPVPRASEAPINGATGSLSSSGEEVR